jgi:hypothetical protein
MMPQSDLFGAIPATPGNATSTFTPAFPSPSQNGGDDFFAMVSQAFTKNPDQLAALQPPPAPASYAPVNNDTPENSDAAAGKSQTTTADASKSKSQQSSSAPANKEDSIDASVLSTIMALLAQPGVLPANLQKLVPAQGKDLKVASEQDGKEPGLLSGSGGPASTQKLPASTLPLPSASLVKEPGNLASNPADQAAMKSPANEDKPLPANISPLGNESPPTNLVKPPTALPQLTASQDVTLAAQERLESAVPIDGMRAALNNQRMKFAAEKNEIAGRTVQKLPDASAPDDFSDDLIGKVDVKSDPDLSGHTKDSFDPNLLIDVSANSSMTDALQGKLAEKTQSTDTAAAQVERVAHLVNQEVLMVRQSGANSLAVSLKVDSHTELFLQLTNHDGQIQASVRCDRGNIEGLGSHWGELQESLARQNVQLMPLADKISSGGNPTATLPSETTSSRAFDQSSQNQQRPARETQEEPSLAGVVGVLTPSRKAKTNNLSRQGWETWA